MLAPIGNWTQIKNTFSTWKIDRKIPSKKVERDRYKIKKIRENLTDKEYSGRSVQIGTVGALVEKSR